MRDDGLLHLDNQFCFALYAASRIVVRAYDQRLKVLDLTYPQYLVMLVLWECLPPTTAKAMAAVARRCPVASATQPGGR